MIEQQSAGIITYITKENRVHYLILHYLSGHWDFAKGKLEPGETPNQAAMRELHEETGLRAHLIPGFEESLSYVFKEQGKTIKKTVTFFVGSTQEQPIRLSREHQGYAWLPFEEAYKALTYLNAKSILNHAHEFIKQHNKEGNGK